MHERLAAADAGMVEETSANCCYAKSDKYWVTDPQGIAWETYHTLGEIPFFGADSAAGDPTACCAPTTGAVSAEIRGEGRPSLLLTRRAARRACGGLKAPPRAHGRCALRDPDASKGTRAA